MIKTVSRKETKMTIELCLHVASGVGLFSFCGDCFGGVLCEYWLVWLLWLLSLWGIACGL